MKAILFLLAALFCAQADAAHALTPAQKAVLFGGEPTALTFSVVSSAIGTQCSSGGESTCTLSSFTVTSGDTLLVGNFVCGSSCGAAPPSVSAVAGSADVGTCVVGTGAHGNNGAFYDDLWVCPITGSGTISITSTYSTTGYFGYVVAADIHSNQAISDDGKGNFASNYASSVSVTATEALSQAVEFIPSIGCASSGGTLSAGNGQTAIQSNTNLVLQYSITVSTAAPTVVINDTSTTNIIVAMATLK